jgi:hypothetical protein
MCWVLLSATIDTYCATCNDRLRSPSGLLPEKFDVARIEPSPELWAKAAARYGCRSDPDRKYFPDYDVSLRDSLVKETASANDRTADTLVRARQILPSTPAPRWSAIIAAAARTPF